MILLHLKSFQVIQLDSGKKGLEPLKLDLKAGILPIKLFPLLGCAFFITLPLRGGEECLL